MYPIAFLLKYVVLVLDAVLWIYFWVLIIRVVLSWIRPGAYHPLIQLVYQMTEPVLAPVRRYVPPFAGLDWSVLLVTVFIYLVRADLLPRLRFLADSLAK